jgi:hypothetical protein
MANIKELIQSIESPDSSFDEKLAVINEMQDTLVAMKEHEQEAIDDNVELIIEALRTIEAKVEAKLRIMPEKGEQGIQGAKGDQGNQGLNGAQGKDGKSGVDGKDGLDGKDGVSVQDAKIDFDGSLVITLSDGREINVGEVVPVDVAQTIHKIQSGSGGDSQTTLNAIAALQATIATYGTMATQNANNVAITGGTINNTTVGATTPSTGVFTTLTATGQTSLGGAAGSEGLRVLNTASSTRYVQIEGSVAGQPRIQATGATTSLALSGNGENGLSFWSNSFATQQFNISHTATAVNYVQVTGSATGSGVAVSAQGSDSNIRFNLSSKGAGGLGLYTNNFVTIGLNVAHTASAVNYVQVTGGATGANPVISAQGSDTNIRLSLSGKGSSAVRMISNGGAVTDFFGVSSPANYINVTNSAASSAPSIASTGSDTNIDLNLTPKGTGNVRFGTFTATILTPTGYVEIKDSGGTVRRLLVG